MSRQVLAALLVACACKPEPSTPVAAPEPEPELAPEMAPESAPEPAPESEEEEPAPPRAGAEFVAEGGLVATAVLAPDPDREALLDTEAGRAHSSGAVTVGFCTGAAGGVTHVEILESFGDDAIDRICLDTVKGWRFEIIEVPGQTQPRRPCFTVTFDLDLS